MPLFERASREKLRFQTNRGPLSAEDLWDIPLTSKNGVSLNAIAQELHHQLASATPSFVEGAGKAVDSKLQLAMDLVLRVIEVRQAEAKVKSEAAAKAAQKQKLLEILGQKKDEELQGLTAEELEARIAAL